jgi:cytochrome P450
MFPKLDQELLWLFPKRKLLHQKMDNFMDMLYEVILKKRDLMKTDRIEGNDLEENEKDLLTLMLESEDKGEGILSDKELKVLLKIQY